jgi:iron complex outermembrane recepter protein
MHQNDKYGIAAGGLTAFYVALIVAFVPSQSNAQSAAPGPPANQAAVAVGSQEPESEGGLETIVVTARKREESVQDVPVAMTAISAEQIARQDLTSLEKVSAVMPNLYIGSNGSAGNQITMRGIGSSVTNISIEQSTAIIVDGAYYGQGGAINEGFFDLARLEVLQGPQALFFGKNATAGVISFTTADPTDKPEFDATSGYEFTSRQIQVGLVGSLPISDTLGIRVAVRGSKMYGGYSTNDAPVQTYDTVDIQDILAGRTATPVAHYALPAAAEEPGGDEVVSRVTLKWTPTDRFTGTVKMSGTISDNDDPNWNTRAFYCPTGSAQLDGTPCTKTFSTHNTNLPADMSATIPYGEADGASYAAYRSYALTGLLTYKLNDATISSVTNYQWNRNRFAGTGTFESTGIDGTWATNNDIYHAFSQELRALSHYDGPFNFMLGGLYQKTGYDYFEPLVLGGLSNSAAPPGDEYLGLTKNSHTDGETESAFAQLTWKIVPTLEAAAGARYTHETKDSLFAQDYVNPGLLVLFRSASQPGGTVTANQDWNDWSPEATLTWKPTKDVMVYGAYKTGYKSGGFSNSALNSIYTSPSSFAFAPEKPRGFEAGLKTTLLDEQLRFNVSTYTYNYENLQVDYFDSAVYSFETIGADARIKGAEVAVEYAPRALRGLNLQATLDYDHARYTSFDEAPCYGGQTQGQGCNLLVGGSPRQNLDGAPLPIAPSWAGTLSARYDTAIGNEFKLGVSADMRYSGAYLTSPFGNADSEQSSFATFDGGVHLGSADDRWEVSIIGKNLTNKFYVTGVIDGPSTGTAAGGVTGIHADQIGFFNLPRTVWLQLSAKY